MKRSCGHNNTINCVSAVKLTRYMLSGLKFHERYFSCDKLNCTRPGLRLEPRQAPSNGPQESRCALNYRMSTLSFRLELC